MTTPYSSDPDRRARYRFSDFELDPETGELFRSGDPVSLPPQAARILSLLVERRGELVSRQEIERHLWPEDTHVETDLSINYVARRIRLALGDSAAEPRFLETLPRRGYRFKAQVEEHRGSTPSRRPARRAALAAAGALAVLAVLALFLGVRQDEETAALENPPRLAVFPLAAADELRALAYGLGEEISIALIRYFGDEIDVLAFSSSRLLGNAPTPDDVAGRLGADFQLTGSLSDASGSLEVRLRLTEVRDGRELWSAAFDVERRELMDARGDLARQFAVALGRKLPRNEPPPAAAAVPTPAYERYLQAVGLIQALPANEIELKEERIEQVQRAIRLLDDCVAEAPDFADGWAALADARLWTDLWLPQNEWAPAVEEATGRALSLDPTHGMALAMAAEVALDVRRDWHAADGLSRRAIRHGKGSYRPHLARSIVLAASGRIGEARHELEIARRLAPLDWVLAYLASSFALLESDFAAAEPQLLLLRQAHPEDPVLVFMLVKLYVLQGDESAALALLRDTHAQAGLDDTVPTTISEYWQDLHDHFQAQHRESFVSVYWRSIPLIGLGRLKEAAALLRAEACGDPFSGLVLIHVDPFFRQLAGLPDYEEAVRCVGMPSPPKPFRRARP